MKTNTNTVTVTVSSPILGRSIMSNAIKFNNLTIARIPPEVIFVDDNYQRQANMKSVHKIAENFDDSKCGFLDVCYHADTGTFSVVDGQHRFLAAKMAGRTEVNCIVHDYENEKHEAVAFKNQDQNRTRVKAYDKFKAGVFAGEDESTAVKAICDRNGVSFVPVGYMPGKTQAVTSIFKVYRKSPECLNWVLNTIMNRTPWGNETKGLQAKYVEMLASLWDEAKSNPQMDMAVVHTLKNASPGNLKAHATMKYKYLGTHAACVQFIRDIAANSEKIMLESV